MKRHLHLATMALACAGALRADVIFGTLDGPQAGGYQVVGAAAQSFGPESVAASFESDWPFLFTGAQVQVLAIQGATFNMTLFASDLNGRPGTPLTTIGSGLSAPGSSGVVAAVSPITLTLTAQTQYWLVLTAAASDTQVSWGVVNGVAYSPVSTTMQTDGAGGWAIVGYEPMEFEIDGVAQTPEPATLTLAGLAFIALLLAKFRSARSARNVWAGGYIMRNALATSNIALTEPNSGIFAVSCCHDGIGDRRGDCALQLGGRSAAGAVGVSRSRPGGGDQYSLARQR